MNILMLNPVHPSTPHISAVRAWRFAQELARMGHHVVLLTATGEDGAIQHSVPSNHDWQAPALLPCAGAPRDTGHRTTRVLLRPVQRARTAWYMVRHGGPLVHWKRATIRVAARLSPSFHPDVAWATFGSMEAVVAARCIARRLGIPWILDLKDNWELYVPRGLRTVMSRRINGFAATTANAKLTQDLAKRWFGDKAILIYSGVEHCFFVPAAFPASAEFTINLVGAIYFRDLLRAFFDGLAAWHGALPAPLSGRVKLRYLGSQGELVHQMAHELVPDLRVDLPGYVTAAEMAQLCQQASLNAYISYPGLFHHKLLELLACGRPVVAFPSETEESTRLAAPATGQLLVPSTPSDLAKTLAELSGPFVHRGAQPDGHRSPHLDRYTWPAQTQLLEQVLVSAVTSSE